MSDTFDHGGDAWEQHLNHTADGNDDYYYDGFDYDELFHHDRYKNIEILQKTKKAYLIKFNNLKGQPESWVPKKLCKELTDKSVYIWEGYTFQPIPKENVDDMFDELPDEIIIEEPIVDNPKNINLKTHYLDGSLREELPF